MKNETNVTIHSLMAFLTFATLTFMLLTACGGAEEPEPVTVPAGAHAGDLVGMEACTYETGDVEFGAKCGILTVPENRSNPNTRLIALPVIRISATGSNPTEPIFWLNGGPGQSNMRFSHPDDLDTLIEDHDFVMVGYRGADGQVLLDCQEISEALRNPPGDLLSEPSLESYGEAADQCAARLQSEGVDLAGYTMTETIDDMEAARDALGYDRINLLGASYGTRLAMIYEWMYPDKLFRVVMLAVNTPGHFVWDAKVIDAQIGDYSNLCARDAHCRDRTNNLVETMRHLSQDMPNRWLLAPIDSDTVKLFTFIMLQESIRPPGDPIGVYGPAAVDMWLAAAEGDASGMALASLARNIFLPNFFTWGHLLAMGGSSGEYSDPTRDFQAEFDPPDSILGSPMSLLAWSMGKGWPANLIPEEYHLLRPTDVETLLQSGSVDFSTPPLGADELMPYLSNGHQVLLEEFGHGNTFWNSQPEARTRMLTAFYDSGTVDDSLYNYQPMDFDVGGGWPGLAKTVLGIVLLVIVLLITLVLLIVWLIRRRRTRQADSRQGP